MAVWVEGCVALAYGLSRRIENAHLWIVSMVMSLALAASAVTHGYHLPWALRAARKPATNRREPVWDAPAQTRLLYLRTAIQHQYTAMTTLG